MKKPKIYALKTGTTRKSGKLPNNIQREMGFHWLISCSIWLLLMDSAEPRKKRVEGGGTGTGSGRWSASSLNVTAVQGVSIIELKCKVRSKECGDFHTIKWYKEPFTTKDNEKSESSALQDIRDNIVNPVDRLLESHAERVYLLFKSKGKAEGSWSGRSATHSYDPNKHVMKVQLRDLQLSDEARYRCEVDYLPDSGKRWFRDVCTLTPQVTNLRVVGRPTFVRVTMTQEGSEDSGDDNANPVVIGSPDDIIGPFTENTKIRLICESGGGRPIPDVTWWNGTRKLTSSWQLKVEHDNGTGSTQTEVSLHLKREHLGSNLTCQVNSTALDTPLSRSVYVDMDIVPERLEMMPPIRTSTSARSPNARGIAELREGDKITVTCIASGAKPEAKIYWNSEPPLNMNDTKETYARETNGWTFNTTNSLTFSAQRALTSLSCFAYNKVMEQNRGVHLQKATVINVKYAPEIDRKKQIINAVRGEPVVIECKFRANPNNPVRVTWYKDGYKIVTGGERSRNQRGDESTLKLEAKDSRAGKYACSAENAIGRSHIVDVAELFVESQPIVAIKIDPVEPVAEREESNVTLICEQRNGQANSFGNNNKRLIGVKWYLDGDLLKYVEKKRECWEAREPLDDSKKGPNCNIDPSKIILVNVKRSFHGNYSCAGRNRAGWGLPSPSKELVVNYQPTEAKIKALPEIVIKGQPFQIKCASEDLGYPKATKVRWFQNGIEIGGEDSFILSVLKSTSSSQGNYSCAPYNIAGLAKADSVQVRLKAPPTFVQRLPFQKGAPIYEGKLELKCVVECEPSCNISWYSNGTAIEEHSQEFSDYEGGYSLNVNSEYTEADADGRPSFEVKTFKRLPLPEKNLLSHVESVLVVQLPSPASGSGLWERRDNTNYTCKASANEMGGPAESTTTFKIHFPPSNIAVNSRRKVVRENEDVFRFGEDEDFNCSAEGYPPPSYYWTRIDTGNRTSSGPKMSIRQLTHGNRLISRTINGTYACTAYNDLGIIKTTVDLIVMYPPNCTLAKMGYTEGMLHLSCAVDAYPMNVSYHWTHNDKSLRTANGALLHHRMRPGSGENAVGTYTCQAKNVAGDGPVCALTVNGPVAALVAETDYTYLMFGGGAVIVVMAITIVSLVACRRHSAAKFGTTLVNTSVRRMGNEQSAPKDPKEGLALQEEVVNAHNSSNGVNGFANHEEKSHQFSTASTNANPSVAAAATNFDSNLPTPNYTAVNKPVIQPCAGGAAAENGTLRIANKKRTTFSLQSNAHQLSQEENQQRHFYKNNNYSNGYPEGCGTRLNAEDRSEEYLSQNGTNPISGYIPSKPVVGGTNQPPPYYHPSHVISHGGGCHDSESFRRDLSSVHDRVTGAGPPNIYTPSQHPQQQPYQGNPAPSTSALQQQQQQLPYPYSSKRYQQNQMASLYTRSIDRREAFRDPYAYYATGNTYGNGYNDVTLRRGASRLQMAATRRNNPDDTWLV